MKKHIFAMAVITLTVGCRPNSSNSLTSQSDTAKVSTMEKHIGTNSEKGLEKTLIETSSMTKSDIVAHLAEITFEATLRLQMDIANVKSPTQRVALLKKLLSLKGAGDLTVLAALQQKKIDLHVEIKDLEQVADKDAQIEAIALSYKEIARIHGLSLADQDAIYKTIKACSSLLTPTTAQKALMKSSMDVIQGKATELSRSLLADETTKLIPTLNTLVTAVQGFMAKDSSYLLPSSLSIATNGVRTTLVQIQTSFAINPLQGKALLGKLLPQVIGNLDNLQKLLNQFLSPLTPITQPNMLRTMEMGTLKETKEYRLARGLTAEGMLEFKDLTCKVDGQAITFGLPKTTTDAIEASANLTIENQRPLIVRKLKRQRGISVGMIYKDITVVSQKGMATTTTDKGEPALAITLIPREEQAFEFTYKEKNNSANRKVSCTVKK